MIDCAMMGVDWRTLTYATYMSLLAEWNLRHDPDPKPEGEFDPDFLERMMRIHG